MHHVLISAVIGSDCGLVNYLKVVIGWVLKLGSYTGLWVLCIMEFLEFEIKNTINYGCDWYGFYSNHSELKFEESPHTAPQILISQNNYYFSSGETCRGATHTHSHINNSEPLENDYDEADKYNDDSTTLLLC